MSSEVESILRRLKPEKRREPLTRRSASALPFAGRASRLPRALLYDTTVYIDILQARFPETGEFAIRAADAWHSTVTEAELIAPGGFLSPDHPETPEAVKRTIAVIRRGRHTARSLRTGRFGLWPVFFPAYWLVFKGMDVLSDCDF